VNVSSPPPFNRTIASAHLAIMRLPAISIFESWPFKNATPAGMLIMLCWREPAADGTLAARCLREVFGTILVAAMSAKESYA
jgi:hypothetical protein